MGQLCGDVEIAYNMYYSTYSNLEKQFMQVKKRSGMERKKNQPMYANYVRKADYSDRKLCTQTSEVEMFPKRKETIMIGQSPKRLTTLTCRQWCMW